MTTKYHWLIDNEILSQTETITNKRKLAKYFPTLTTTTEEENLLKHTLESIEFEIIEKWNDDPNLFSQLCRDYFEIIETLSPPGDEIECIHFILKLITYGYLGEKWEAARRYLIENEKQLILNPINTSENWRATLLYKIYHAIFHIVRKNSWDDLTKALEIIVELRKDQKKYEKSYIESESNSTTKKAISLDLASLYHLAKSVEIVGQFLSSGKPNDPTAELSLHFENAIKYTELSSNIELNLLLRLLWKTFDKMISNSVWQIAKAVNSRVTKFIELITKSNKPVFELLYPQRNAILDNGLLDPAKRAIVVDLPTSSGKTFIAEFRILQALNQFADEKGWVAYVAPTRALVNQISIRLRKDFGQSPLNLIVEKMSGAVDVDAYEQELLDDKINFDVLVTTPEKLSLIIRQGKIQRPLSLVVVDEAHNIASNERGINLEILLSIIKYDCTKANYLLLTPFIPNADEVAKWLDPQQSKSIGIELNWWQPNDRSIGIFYAKGKGHQIQTYYHSLVTNKSTIPFNDEIQIEDKHFEDYTISKIRTSKSDLTSIVASQFSNHDSILILANRVRDTYKIADNLAKDIDDLATPDKTILLARKFIISELGEDFPLANFLLKGIGIHHSGLPEEVRFLMETLMERGLIKYLVATSTIAQGINFPVSAILMATYSYPYTSQMPINDFWNLAGRAGRIDQRSVGIVGIASKDDDDSRKITAYLKEATVDLASTLERMVDEAIALSEDFNLEMLYNRPEWSIFLQYIAHMYKQSENLSDFLNAIELTMRRTWGYSKLPDKKRKMLLEKVKKYAESLDSRKNLTTISDNTGFSPESIHRTIGRLSDIDITIEDWKKDTIFSNKPKTLQKLVGIMMQTPELSKSFSDIKISGKSITRSQISLLISDWVSGKDIPYLTETYFKGDSPESISDCVKAIYGKLVNSATWGLSAFQKIPGSGLLENLDKLSESEKRNISNLPAMIYYGVNTNEALLLRKANVPRSISLQLGETLKDEVGNDLYSKSNHQVTQILNELDADHWQKAIPKNKSISGNEMKQVWKMLAGLE
jgi:replicative superfamily II helicase